MRGKPGACSPAISTPGITPAGAGKTGFFFFAFALLEDHPRRCGENFNRFQCFKFHIGSPPQVRGKQVRQAHSGWRNRITPAGAGKTASIAVLIASRTDHPRRCGENNAAMVMKPGAPGSPPQVRGKPVFRSREPNPSGITPAGAGKTRISSSRSGASEDHPRRCGENHHPPVGHHRRGGSPPQVRGKQYMNDSKKALLRITPAGAGKTKTKRTLMDVIRDHPRRCGENWDTSCCIIAADGSPPQVRGKQPFHSYRLCSSRITPAGAGKTARVDTGCF